ASLLAKIVNGDTGNLNEWVALTFFASRHAPGG
ncbi:outer membrane lipoprotein carrier protein LolA, partial [Pseudomonas marginalis]